MGDNAKRHGIFDVEERTEMTQEQLQQAVEEYKQIYLKKNGVELSDYEATTQATNLLNLFSCLTGNDTLGL